MSFVPVSIASMLSLLLFLLLLPTILAHPRRVGLRPQLSLVGKAQVLGGSSVL